jgi:integrase/recombinase XerD
MLLADAVVTFLRMCEFDKNLSPLTLRAYRMDLFQLQKFVAVRGDCRVDEIDAELVQNFVSWLRVHLECADTSIRRKVAVVRALVRWLEERGVLGRNPFWGVRLRFRCAQRLPSVLSAAQVSLLLAAARRPAGSGGSLRRFAALRDHALLELLFFTGARISELLRLDVADLDLEAGVTRIKGKGRRERVVYIGNKAVLWALRRYLVARRRLLLLEESALFVSVRWRRLSVFAAEALVRRRASSVGILGRITPHVFRHTVATMLLENGADLRSIQEILGHASIRTTEIYTHISGDRKRRVMLEFHPRQHLKLAR